jgi:hypothetical protein
MAERRDLSFDSLDDVMPDVETLMSGNVTVGRWSLGQICNHLSTGLVLPMSGRPDPSLQPVPDAFRRRMLRRERFPDGMQAPLAVLLPGEGLDVRKEADTLRSAIKGFSRSEGPFLPHPALGLLTKVEWTRFHCLHCAHHLGFALPQ